MQKAPDAFRTISEVAELLDTPPHVLRFWESRFTQVSPVKRAGGRRYYRPADLALLGGIKQLLHHDGMTIRGVQKLLKDHGARHVAALADPALLAANEAAAPQDGREDTPEVAQPAAPQHVVSDPVPAAPENVPDDDAGAEEGVPEVTGPEDTPPEDTPPEDSGPDSTVPRETAAETATPETAPARPEPKPPATDDAPPPSSATESPAMSPPAETPDLASIAARLRRLSPEDIEANRAALDQLRKRLVALHARRAETLVAGRI